MVTIPIWIFRPLPLNLLNYNYIHLQKMFKLKAFLAFMAHQRSDVKILAGDVDLASEGIPREICVPE